MSQHTIYSKWHIIIFHSWLCFCLRHRLVYLLFGVRSFPPSLQLYVQRQHWKEPMMHCIIDVIASTGPRSHHCCCYIHFRLLCSAHTYIKHCDYHWRRNQPFYGPCTSANRFHFHSPLHPFQTNPPNSKTPPTPSSSLTQQCLTALNGAVRHPFALRICQIWHIAWYRYDDDNGNDGDAALLAHLVRSRQYFEEEAIAHCLLAAYSGRACWKYSESNTDSHQVY